MIQYCFVGLESTNIFYRQRPPGSQCPSKRCSWASNKAFVTQEPGIVSKEFLVLQSPTFRAAVKLTVSTPPDSQALFWD